MLRIAKIEHDYQSLKFVVTQYILDIVTERKNNE